MKNFNDSEIPLYPYPELREVLDIFVNEIIKVLNENLIGVYLVGSIATGDFDLDSDVDFLVVTKVELTEENMKYLQDVQIKVHNMDCYPAKHLEGSYICIDDLNDWSTVGQKNLWYFDNGSTTYELSTHDNQWHVRWVLRERAIPLVGPKPDTLLPEIPLDKLNNEIQASMLRCKESFKEDINQPLSFSNSRFGQSFFVLTICRMMHTLHTGTVQSKKAGANWAKQFVDPKWVALIDQAWHEREGVRFMEKIHQRAEQRLLDKTLEFINDSILEMDQFKPV